MARFSPYDLRERIGELVRQVPAEDFVKRYLRNSRLNDIYMQSVEAMLRKACADQQATEEEMWDTAAKLSGFASAKDCHAQGFALSIEDDYIGVRRDPRSVVDSNADPTKEQR